MIKAVTQCIVIVALMAGLLLGLAGTTDWFGAYAFLASFGLGGLVMTLWLGFNDPALLKERIEKQRQKKPGFEIIPVFMNVYLAVWLGAMALDARWNGVTQMPVWINIVAGIAVFAGFLLVIPVLKENTFATAVVKIQPERGHKVIDVGPYALVRHPMYCAACLSYIATPFALGSKLGVFGAPVLLLCVVVRILFEERLLERELPGYCDYMTNVRYRLVPFIW